MDPVESELASEMPERTPLEGPPLSPRQLVAVAEAAGRDSLWTNTHTENPLSVLLNTFIFQATSYNGVYRLVATAFI